MNKSDKQEGWHPYLASKQERVKKKLKHANGILQADKTSKQLDLLAQRFPFRTLPLRLRSCGEEDAKVEFCLIFVVILVFVSKEKSYLSKLCLQTKKKTYKFKFLSKSMKKKKPLKYYNLYFRK